VKTNKQTKKFREKCPYGRGYFIHFYAEGERKTAKEKLMTTSGEDRSRD